MLCVLIFCLFFYFLFLPKGRMGSIAHATSDNSIKGLAPGNYTFNESDTIPPIVCRAASGEPVDGSIHLNGTLFNGSSAVTMNPATDRQIIYYVPSMGGSSGVYTCTGFNQFNTPADTVRRVFRITIQFRPDFAGTVNRQIVHLGDQLVLSCRVSAFPELTNLNVLYPNDTRTDSLVADLSAGTSRDVRKVTFLDAPATAAHAGNYSCNGRNLVGASSQQIEVIVLGKYYFRVLFCSFVGEKIGKNYSCRESRNLENNGIMELYISYVNLTRVLGNWYSQH